MEVLIGMAIAFLLGAYVRKPFVLFKRKTETAVLPEKKPEQDTGRLPVEEQFANMMSFTGKKQEH